MGKFFNYYLPNGSWVCKHGVTKCKGCIPPHIRELIDVIKMRGVYDGEEI